MRKLYIFIVISLFWTSFSSAGLMFTYSQLILKDLDQMNGMVKVKIKEFKKEGSVEILKEAAQAVYSRPNDDGMVEKIITPLRNELDEQDQWETTMEALVHEAIGALKNTKAFKPTVQNTYGIFLQNVVADFKPFAEKEGFERKIIKMIADAKIEFTKEALNERKLRIMSSVKSPSGLATNVLEDISKAEAEAKKAEAEAKKKEK